MELAKILLMDSAHIQEMEAEWQPAKTAVRERGRGTPLHGA